ncbi:MAG: response regulator [Sphingomonadales bacterium]|nr:response regulator [Sphingomonadales bacterium]
MAKILVMDDDAGIRELIRDVLEESGHEVTEAEDGNKGMELLQNVQFDLVITDIVMPEKEGLETIIELRTCRPDLKIIAISGGGSMDGRSYLEIAELFGANRIFPKPIKMSELLVAVDEVLQPALQ